MGAAGFGGVAALGGLSGCTSDSSESGSGESIPTTNWLAARDTWRDDGPYASDSLGLRYTNYDQIRAHLDELPSGQEVFKVTEFMEGVTESPIAGISSLNGNHELYHGSFDVDAVVSGLEREGLEHVGSYREYELAKSNIYFAIGEDAIVQAVTREDIENLIDTSQGDFDRGVETDDGLATVLNTLGDSTGLLAASWERPARSETFPDGRLAFGHGTTLHGEQTTFTYTSFFDHTPSESEQSRFRDVFSPYEFSDISVTSRGQLLKATITYDTASVDRTFPYTFSMTRIPLPE